MEPNNEQGIQLEYLSNLDVQQTNEWLDSITVEQIEELYVVIWWHALADGDL